MQKKILILLITISTILSTSCDAVLQNIQKSQQAQIAANQAAGKAPNVLTR
jgi:hypothetical protein